MTDHEQLLRLTLYVAGQTPRAERALMNLRRIITDELGMPFELDIVDVLERPDLAEEALILATPTLVKEAPPPARRLIGDLTDTQKVLRGLHVPLPLPKESTPSGEPHS